MEEDGAREEHPGWFSRFLSSVHAALGYRESPTPEWNDDVVAELADVLDRRERRLLLLFCDGPRPVIPCTELKTKFGCGVPFSGDRDTPRLAAFTKAHDLPFPLTTVGTDEKAVANLAWSQPLAKSFRRRFPRTPDLQQRDGNGTSQTPPVDTPA